MMSNSYAPAAKAGPPRSGRRSPAPSAGRGTALVLVPAGRRVGVQDRLKLGHLGPVSL
jgi:hypothetical protein